LSRKQRRAARPRRHIYVKHTCGRRPCKAPGFSETICVLHSYRMMTRGEYGREYPAPVCYECLPAHETFCPMGNPAALVSWINGGNPMTCICPSRLSQLGLQLVHWQPETRRSGGDLLRGRGTRRLAIAAKA
jgi:hypothetical protein